MVSIKKAIAALLGFLCIASTAGASCAGTVTIVGNVIDNYGNPAVGLRVVEYPLKWTLAGCSLVMPNQVSATTDSAGDWSMTVEGGLLAAIFVPPGGNIPYGLIQATLPTSGVVSYATLAAQQPNVLTAFPPLQNLNMGGFGFTNMAGATGAGGAMAYGSGLGGPQLFTANGTFTIPTNATLVDAKLIGAGAGGGGSVGGGGGQGQFLDCLFLASGGSGTVVVGAAGMGGASGANGTDGADTTFTQTSGAACDAGGGKHGTHGAPGSGGAGGNAGTPATGGVIQESITNGTAGANGSGGTGGAGGANGGPGGGGNGGSTGNAGTNGNPGYVLVTPF